MALCTQLPPRRHDLFAKTFLAEHSLCDGELNDYSNIEFIPYRDQKPLTPVSCKAAAEILGRLEEDSVTAPDLLPARILKYCAEKLAEAVCLPAQRILNTGRWPALWTLHWIVPLYKKKSVFDPGSYRAVRLTAQLSKSVERLLKNLYAPYVSATVSFGPISSPTRRDVAPETHYYTSC